MTEGVEMVRRGGKRVMGQRWPIPAGGTEPMKKAGQ